ncbi:MAG: GNAT family N-acetyltransferase [Saprospiraceae bacterium]|nr:GNAT family N-acetyltransferase [Saprospiraceae bacterium]
MTKDSFINPAAFIPFPEQSTERLLLTRKDLRFVNDHFEMRTNQMVMRYFDRAMPSSVEEVKIKMEESIAEMESGKALVWALVRKEDQVCIGDVAFWKIDPQHAVGEIGYGLLPEYWGQGYMQEVLKQVLPYAFQSMGLHRVEANVNTENRASQRLLEKMGFQKEAHFRENYAYNGKFLDSLIFGLLEKDLL